MSDSSATPPHGALLRLQSSFDLDLMDFSADPEFNGLVEAAALVCGAPGSLISLVDNEGRWVKAKVGLQSLLISEPDAAFADFAFCRHAIRCDELFEVADARLDPRFADNPLVTGEAQIRYYAGAALSLSDGARVGTLCVLDHQPRQLDSMQRQVLSRLALSIGKALEARMVARRLRGAAIQHARAALVLDYSADAVIGVSAGGLIERWNPAAERMFGCRLDAVAGRHLNLLVPADAQASLAESLARVEHSPPETFEARWHRPDGTLIEVAVTRVAEFDLFNRFVGNTLFVRDVSARKHAEAELRRSQDFLQRTGTLAGVGGWEVDVASRTLRWTDEMRRIYGVPPDFTPTLNDAIAFFTEESRRVIDAAMAALIKGDAGFDIELEIVRRDGARRWVQSVASVERVDGRPVRVAGAIQDITERRRLTADLAEQHELLRVTLESIGDAVITTDAAGKVTWLNPVAERLTGWCADEAVGRPLQQIFHLINEVSRQPIENPAISCLHQDALIAPSGHAVLIARDGEEFGIQESVAPIRNARGELLGVVLVFHDVTEQRRLSGEMRYRASHDPLTGLLNRTEFEHCLSRALQQAHETQATHALMFIDLDQFKLVNDACGHAAGDLLLQQVARLLLDTLKIRSTIARLGGDEFAVLLELCSAEQAQLIAQELCDRIDDFRFVHDERRFRIGTSIGLVPLDRRWSTITAAMQAADSACYAAKEAGRNRVHQWFDTDLAMRARQGETQWATRLAQAIDDDRFVLYAQRKYPLRGQIEGLHAETLLRMLDVDGSLIQPGVFLPAAERFHLAPRLDRWVLRRAIDALRMQSDLTRINTLCVNLSGQSISDQVFHRQAIDILSEAGTAICKCLCLEITETAAVTHIAAAASFIDQVRRLGVRIALDDFGAGASSFGYLKSLAVDVLKIDGRFVRDLIDDPLDEAALLSFVNVARVIGVPTVAEWVERPEVLARLREIGVDYAQGFLLHRPEPLAEVLRMARVDSYEGAASRS